MADPAAFDFFFQQADLDRDGRVSGAEAIQFFKGTNLPQPVLAKIWHAADNGHTGFLSRPEFYNALKLVTVAQSGRELTPEIMRAALVGPASLKIPAPKIQLSSGQQSVPQPQTQPSPPIPTQTSVPQATRTSFSAPIQTIQQQAPSFSNAQQLPGTIQQTSRPPFPSASTQQPQQVASFSSASTLQPQQMPSFPSTTPPQIRGPIQPAYQQQPPGQSVLRPTSSGGPGTDTWRPSVQGQLFSSAAPVRPTSSLMPNPSLPSPALNNGPGSSFPQQQSFTAPPAPRAGVGATTAPGGTKATGADSPFGSDTFLVSSTSTRPGIDPNFAASPAPSLYSQARPAVTTQAPVARNMQGYRPPSSWPKMTTNDIQRYSRVFSDVDTDKDGKITGIQARDLFLSWRLPRDVLKQVWDLSDQDGDSMLSFREFSTALYLMERFREGRPLPPILPAGIHFDGGPPQSTGVPQQNTGYQPPSWQRNARPMQEQFGMPGFQGPPTTKNSRSRPRNTEFDSGDKSLQNDGKVLDSKEKLEYYRNKLQEIVLFKRKCDNRLAEITDRAAAEKREEELMAKKYEEKYKQALEVNTRLVAEEAAFRETQTLKLELRNAIGEIERGGNPNALLQTRADRISNDLDELEKALIQRGKLLGLNISGTAPIELPFGWQPGLQENAVEWDEDWDKFDDEGYTTIQGIMDQQPDVTTSLPGWDDNNIFADGFDFASESNQTEEHIDKAPAESPRAESETSSVKSGVDSPQWSPKSYPSKRSLPGSSPLSAKADHSFESHEDEPSLSASFDQEPSFDSTDHYEDKPWSSAFSNQNNDLWGSEADSPSSSFEPLAVRTRPQSDSLDLGSSSISSPPAKNEKDFFGKKDWNDWSGDIGNSSVPSTPLFKSESPANQGSIYGQPSRLDL